jgi:hypothetical protein
MQTLLQQPVAISEAGLLNTGTAGLTEAGMQDYASIHRFLIIMIALELVYLVQEQLIERVLPWNG